MLAEDRLFATLDPTTRRVQVRQSYSGKLPVQYDFESYNIYSCMIRCNFDFML